ncbi:MAG: HAMP domain-containing histidine kinase [Clostridia bacterium]|nr:HAMP domain-containing histidine kinase [Clostridia bacterium]
MFLTVICIVLFVLLCIAVIKLISMYKALSELQKDMDSILNEETNVLLSVSVQDKAIRRFVANLNKQISKLREERHKYKAGDRELQSAITNIAHDIRTPLTAISGYVELLDKEEKSDKVNTYLSYIRNRTDHLKKLTEELFKYTIYHANENLELTECDIRALLEQTLLEYYGALKERNIEPEILLPKDKVLRKVNPAALSRVYANIINNAIKYSSGDLSVTLSEKGIIRFTNTSASLDEIQVGRLFDRFYTVEAAHKSTGLGLSIARELVNKMNGIIEADFNDGKLTITIVFA